MTHKSKPWRVSLAAALGAALAFGGGSASWEMNSYSEFVKGKFSGISLTRDGRLTLAPRLDALFASGEAGVWSIVAGRDGSVYLGTGHRGRVYRIPAGGGAASVYWTAPEPEVFALAVGPDGALYAGTSPDGRIWRIENGQAKEYYRPLSKYIWSLAFGRDGSLYCGTGDNGRIFRVSAEGRGELWYETGQSHVTSLAVDAQGRLLAGTEPNGIVYRVNGKDRAFVLYDSTLPEIRSLIPAADGSVYVAALGGSVAQKQAQTASAAAAAQQSGASVSTSIRITADTAAQQGGLELKQKAEAAKTQAPALAEAPPPTSPIVEVSGVEKSAIYRIAPDNMVETLWSSKEENVFDIAVDGRDITFSTDQRGRIYRLTPELKSVLLVETREGETTRLLPEGGALLAATSNLGKLFRLNSGLSPKGIYESPVHDAGNAARWGRLEWNGSPGAGRFTFRTRSGNSARPDKTWSDWSEASRDPASAVVSSPNARYLQWQVEIDGGAGAPPLLDSVTVTYQPQNGRPVVRSIQVYPQWVAAQQKGAQSTQPQGTASYSVTVTDSADSSADAASAGNPTQAVGRSGHPQIYITWQADDPDNDPLVYSVWYRAEDERDWKLLKDRLTENTLAQDAEVFADGRYFFRVVASDAPANPPQTARQNDLISQPFLLDQTPPRLTVSTPRRTDNAVEVDIDAEDAASPLRRAEYSLDAGPWQLLEAADGITDSRKERFVLRLSPPLEGEHAITVRVYDTVGNPGLARILLR